MDAISIVMVSPRQNSPSVCRMLPGSAGCPASCSEFGKFKNIRVLIAEDNPGSQVVASTMLEIIGCKSDLASNGRDAARLVSQNHYDLVLMDCNLPDMNGFEATAEIRRSEGDRKHTIIVALTANAINGYREKCLLAGMDDYLSKPVRSEDLHEMVERWAFNNANRTHPRQVDTVSEWNFDEVFDSVRLNKLISIFRKTNRELVQTVVEPFLKNVEENLPVLYSAAEEKNYSSLTETAHFLQGGSRNLGLQKITKICAGIQENANRNHDENIKMLVGSLEMELPIVRQQVVEMRGKGIF